MKSNLLKIGRSESQDLAGLEWGAEPVKGGGKGFHTEEASFRRSGLTREWELTSGRENFIATRL
jgi:hypothetical protein